MDRKARRALYLMSHFHRRRFLAREDLAGERLRHTRQFDELLLGRRVGEFCFHGANDSAKINYRKR